jgi:hypothetical protein
LQCSSGLRPSWNRARVFERGIGYRIRFLFGEKVETLAYATAIFRQVNKNEQFRHHDALEFPDGRLVLLTQLCSGQEATVLQLPAQPTSETEADSEKRAAYVN